MKKINKNYNYYTNQAIYFHWIVALLIFITMPMGFLMEQMLFSPLKLELIGWHKSIGVAIFSLMLLRIFWRLSHTPPKYEESIEKYEKFLSKITHAMLYLLLLAIPVSGYLMSSAKGYKTIFLGKALPDLIAKNEIFGKLLEKTHTTLNIIMAILIALHILAAFRHHFFKKNNILKRMLPK